MSLAEKYSPDNPAQKVHPGLRFVFSHPAHALALFFGAGSLHPAPGTWGSLAAVLVWALLSLAHLPWQFLSALIVAVFFLGVWASQKTMDDLGVEDPGCVVIDEVVAVWVLCLMLPQTITAWVLVFVFFRIFDILKMPGAAWFDKNWKNGWGVMIDDLFAAAWALLVIILLDRILAVFSITLLGVF